jgi:hypothetical protein
MSLLLKSLKILLGGVILTATLNARNLYIIDSPSEVKNYVSKATKGDFAVVKTDGVFVRYIFDGKNFVALEDRDLLKSASSTLPFSGYAKSCKDILDRGESHGDGVYTIDPDGKGGEAPFKVYCDMTTDGGGWTLIVSQKDQYWFANNSECDFFYVSNPSPQNPKFSIMKYIDLISKLKYYKYMEKRSDGTTRWVITTQKESILTSKPQMGSNNNIYNTSTGKMNGFLLISYSNKPLSKYLDGFGLTVRNSSYCKYSSNIYNWVWCITTKKQYATDRRHMVGGIWADGESYDKTRQVLFWTK